MNVQREEISLGEALKNFRKRFKVSSKDAATEMGVSPQMYSTYESNKALPSVKYIINLAKSRNVSTDYLLGLTDEPNQALAPVPAPEDEFTRAAIVFADAMRNAVNQRLQEKAEV